MLLTIEEIKKGLDGEFLELEPDIIGYRLIDSKMDEFQIQELNSIFSVNLPNEFTEII